MFRVTKKAGIIRTGQAAVVDLLELNVDRNRAFTYSKSAGLPVDPPPPPKFRSSYWEMPDPIYPEAPARSGYTVETSPRTAAITVFKL